MTKRRIALGIDTSNYTTSMALADIDTGEVIGNYKIPLIVKAGERGLRQSDAVFLHVKNIPELSKRVGEALSDAELCAVGVSSRPRSVEGSYMPCFLSGVATATAIASVNSVPLFEFSHQCGHLMAAVYSSGEESLLSGESFCAFHVSGGTTEMLRVRYENEGFSAELVGGTSDLNAGQVIDRVGVMMGLEFPSGAALERLALENTEKFVRKKAKLSGSLVSLSGLENMADKLYRDTGDKRLVSAFVLDYVAGALVQLRLAYGERFGEERTIFAGGVMRNSIIKSELKRNFSPYFAEPDFSSDNAAGIALLTRKKYQKQMD